MKRAAAVLLALLAVALIRASGPEPAPRTGEWSVAGSLERPRAYGTAVPLSDGTILVLGGMDAGRPEVTVPTSELIDPAAGTVRTLKDQLAGRLHQTATLTVRGKVVVAGGVEWRGGHFGSTDRVDLFEPLAKRWTAGAPLHQARSDHGAVALADGTVLVTGGNFNARPLASSELYDPAADAWRFVAPLSHPRIRFSIAALPDGRVIAVGGLDEKGRPLASSEIYDVKADRWTAGPDLSVPRVQHAAVVLKSGDVVLIGGQSAASNTAERYDIASGTFVYAGTLVTPRLVEQAAVLQDGRVLITGGSVEKPGRTEWVPVRDAEVWDPTTNTWSAFPSPQLNRALGELVPTSYGVFLISGIGDDQAPHRAIEKLTFK